MSQFTSDTLYTSDKPDLLLSMMRGKCALIYMSSMLQRTGMESRRLGIGVRWIQQRIRYVKSFSLRHGGLPRKLLAVDVVVWPGVCLVQVLSFVLRSQLVLHTLLSANAHAHV
jgi:hypothetical protein